MVDAINAINAATQTRINQNKDLAVNWKSLTAKEVLEHAQKGDEVPIDVLRWAEDYAKLEDAPDNVSYEAVNGATKVDNAQEEAGGTDLKVAEEVDNDESKDEEQPEEISLYDQAQILIPESDSANTEVKNAVRNAKQDLNRGEQISSEASNEAKRVEMTTNYTKSEYDELVNKIEGDKKNITSDDLLKLDKLSNQLLTVGNAAQTKLGLYDIQLQEIETVFSQYQTLPNTAIDKGNETIDVGVKLVATTPANENEIITAATENAESNSAKLALSEIHFTNWGILFDRNYIMGRNAILHGSDAVNSGKSGDTFFVNANSDIQEYKTEVQNAISSVEESTLVQGKAFNINTNNSNNSSNTENSTAENKNSNNIDNLSAKNNTLAKNDPINKDTNIQADDIELRKRKENRGEIEPA